MTAQISSQPVDVPDRRGSDYSELSRRVKAAGLLGRRPGYYRWKFAATAGAARVRVGAVRGARADLVAAGHGGLPRRDVHPDRLPRARRRPQAGVPDPVGDLRLRPDRRQRGHRPELRLVDGQAQPAPRAPERPRARSRRARRCPGLRRPPGRRPARLRPAAHVDPGLPVLPDAALEGMHLHVASAAPCAAARSDRAGSRARCCCCTCRRTSRSSRWCSRSGRRWRSSLCSRACSASTWASRSRRTTRACRWSGPRTTGTTCAAR